MSLNLCSIQEIFEPRKPLSRGKGLLQEDIGHKVRRTIEAKIEALKAVHSDHKQSEKDKQMAVRYHRVSWQYLPAV